MRERASDSVGLLVSDLIRWGVGWLRDGETRLLSPRSVGERRELLSRVEWWARTAGVEWMDRDGVREYLAWVATGHLRSGGRWGTDHPSGREPVRPSTVHSHWRRLRCLLRWLEAEGRIPAGVWQGVTAPRLVVEPITPFTDSQLAALLRAARAGVHPARDVAILRVLVDTGCRAGELCGLVYGDLDLDEWRLSVTGKSGRRWLGYGRLTHRALWSYLGEEPARLISEPVFLGDRGLAAGEALGPGGLFQLVQRWGVRADLKGVRCSPHTFRHTFALRFLLAGGDVFTLRAALGHSSLTMVQRYLAISGADVVATQRRLSVCDAIGLR